ARGIDPDEAAEAAAATHHDRPGAGVWPRRGLALLADTENEALAAADAQHVLAQSEADAAEHGFLVDAAAAFQGGAQARCGCRIVRHQSLPGRGRGGVMIRPISALAA